MMTGTQRRTKHSAPTRWRGGSLSPIGLRGIAMTALAVLWVAPLGCGVLDTRTPEDPIGDEIDFESPTEPRIVLSNIEATLEAGSEVNYDNSLSDDFTMTPAAEEEGICPPEWSKQQEVDQTRIWLGNVGEEEDIQLDLTFTPAGGDFDDLLDAGTSELGETQQYYQDLEYTLEFTSITQGTATYSGLCDLYFREVGALWVVYDWIDKAGEGGNLTWSRLRCNPEIEF